MTFKAFILGLFIMATTTATYAGHIKMCSQNGAEDPGNFLQFSIDTKQQQIIFLQISGNINICDYEEIPANNTYNHLYIGTRLKSRDALCPEILTVYLLIKNINLVTTTFFRLI